MKDHANPSIKCSVSSCSHHCSDSNYCTLSEIRVGGCRSNVTDCTSTECASFELGKGGCSCR